MAIPRLNQENLPLFEKYIAAIDNDAQRKWGRLTAAGLLRHLSVAVQSSLGELPAKDKSIPVLRSLIRLVFFHCFTRWPGGVFGAPDSFTPEPEGDVAAERAQLLEDLRRFTETLEKEPGRVTSHPILGPLNLQQYAHTHGVHFWHHFRQFSVLESK